MLIRQLQLIGSFVRLLNGSTWRAGRGSTTQRTRFGSASGGNVFDKPSGDVPIAIKVKG
jgi:hypothetical protein